jgi:hypothetical protein
MTTQATTEGRPNGRTGVLTQLAMTAISLAIVGGVLLWQVRPASEPESAVTSTTTTSGTLAMNEGAPALGGLAERYRDLQTSDIDTGAPALGDVGLTDGLGHVHTEAAALPAVAVAPPTPNQRARTGPPTIYIVSSPEQVGETYAFLDHARGMLTDASFEQPGPAEVVWFDAPEAEASYWTTHDAMQVRDGVTYSVIDLRRPASGTRETCGTEVGQRAC